MSSHSNLPEPVRELVKDSHLFSLSDFASLADLSPEQCAEVLAVFVANGVLRKVVTVDGTICYWMVTDPNEVQAGAE